MLFVGALVAVPGGNRAAVRVADGFDMPVGKPDAEGYYMSRGFLSYHPGEDWNGVAGGNSVSSGVKQPFWISEFGGGSRLVGWP